MKMRVRVAQLTTHTVTRSRGSLAFDSLKPYLERNQPVEIHIDGEHPVSLSFLDELVRRLAESAHLTQVTFLVHEGDALRKLSRIAAIRRVDIGYFDPKTGSRSTVKRLPPLENEVSGTRVKPEAATDIMPAR